MEETELLCLPEPTVLPLDASALQPAILGPVQPDPTNSLLLRDDFDYSFCVDRTLTRRMIDALASGDNIEGW
jgi:hypothetical protein